MLAERSRVPLFEESPRARLQELLEERQQPDQGQQKNPSEMLNFLVNVFDAF
jgi:hypothetical protein